MDYRRFGNTMIVRIDRGEEIVEKTKEACIKEGVKLGAISALGAVKELTVGVFDLEKKEYHANEFKGTFEIVSLVGSVNTMDGECYLHLHMSVGDEQGRVFGGHLNRAIVSATCEMTIQIIEGVVDRQFSEEVGINLYKFVD